MAETSFINTTLNSLKPLCPNPEAHQSRQLLQHLSDEEDGEETDIEEEEQKNDEVDVHEEDHNHNNLMIESNNDYLNHSISTPALPSTQRFSFPTDRNRDFSSNSTATTAKFTPTRQNSAPIFAQTQQAVASSKQTNAIDRHLTTTNTTNEYHDYDYSELKPFNETIDFSFNASTTRIVFESPFGYQKAVRALERNQIPNEPTRNYADIWSFCLQSRTLRFYFLSEFHSQMLNSSQDITPPQARISPFDLLMTDSPFWLVFERRPIFHETHFNVVLESNEEQLLPTTNNTIIDRIKPFLGVHLNLSYGALTSMNEYYHHPKYNFPKRTQWTIIFRLKKFEIERFESKHTDKDNHCTQTFRKTILPAELIDRTAIFTVGPLGFSVYICVKGNLHEYTRTTGTGVNGYQTERQSSDDNNCPVFSTICLHTLVKTGTSNFNLNDHDRYCALHQVKSLFKSLLDFFYHNQISVCFASIQSHRGCTIDPLSHSNFCPTPIQIYAFTMLRNVGYSVEQKLSQHKKFFVRLLDLAKEDDDIFYRLCMYLFRRATEYHFLNLDRELENANREYSIQFDQCKSLNEQMATILSPPRENYAYVPSIRVTPTTVQIHPLKLVKLHRVLREKYFDDPLSFALVEIRDEANKPLYARDFRSLRVKFRKILNVGIQVNETLYRYLHHSMSQVKEKQFWFLDSRYSLEDVRCWMGNFDNERVVAKHAARIAQCFTSTEPSISIPAEHVKYIPDIETEDKQYCFTDGVGTISQEYCKKVQKALGRRHMPSVLQIRYGGCKGTVSVDPCLDDQPKQLIIRHSMLKFTSDHDQLEICKVSAPRALYLNRQDILLLSGRDIPESYFLVLQNENHLWLVQALLCSSIAFELLNDRVGSAYFHFRDIASTFNLVEEPFFLQLLIRCGHDCVSKFQQRAKIKIAKNKARNMFGIVDEYGVLEYGQVFIQYSHMNDEKLEVAEKPPVNPPTVLDNVKVVITKNPCHHPGDLRTFMAVDRVELRHLVDVVVFPQKGPRPHPNEISGSDLDGDEYAVIWDEDLVPPTENDEPYNYDSQEEPVKLDRPVERKDINEIVLDIAAQNLTGDMSNLHLALADLLGTRHPEVVSLAGLISQELDAPKTGKHPITNEGLHCYRTDLLKERYPDFMMRERYKSYPSAKIIGQLYRSARRAIIRWHKAARTHCSLRHLKTAQLEDGIEDDEDLTLSSTHSQSRQSFNYTSNLHEPSLILDPAIQHSLSSGQLPWAKNLFSSYRENLRNIISVFNYQDEIDLFCRCEALDQLASGKQDLNISAGLELQRLIDTTRRRFYYDFEQLAVDETYKPLHKSLCTRHRTCEGCNEIKLARAAACYYVCYSQAAKQSTKARSRILSFPWLFGSFLKQLKEKNQNLNTHNSLSKYIVIGRTMRNYAKRLIENKELKLKIFWPRYSDTAHIFLRPVKSTMAESSQPLKRIVVEKDQQTHGMCLERILFIEIMNHWIRKQNVFGEHSSPVDKKPMIREICWHQLLIKFISHGNLHFEEYRVVFQTTNNATMTERYIEQIKREISLASADFDTLMYDYCILLVRLCFQIAREQKSNDYAYLSDYLVLALQAIGIEKDLNDLAIDIDT